MNNLYADRNGKQIDNKENPALRRTCSIHAYKILNIKGNRLIVRNLYNREKTFDLISVKNPEDYEIGDYIDAIVNKLGTSSCIAQFLGKTPPEFVPNNGQEIS